MQGVDAATGAIRFTRSVELDPGAMEASEPCVVGHGEEHWYATAVARQFEGTKIVLVDGQGRLRHERLVGREQPFVAYDAGFKLMTAITSPRRETLVASWTYRQIRRWGTAVMRIDAPGIAWRAEERCIGCARDGVVVCVGLPAEAPVLVGRGVDDGRELYRAALGNEAIAALVTRDAVLVVDRAAQYAAYAARDEELTELAVSERLDMEEALRRMDTHPGVPATLRVLDARTGEEQTRYELPGDIVHVAPIGVGAAVVASTPEGRGECLVLNRAGEQLARFPAPGRRLDGPWKSKDNLAPRVLGARGGTLFYATAETLFGIDMASCDSRWEMALPARADGFRPQIRERPLAKADVACDGEVLAVRGRDRLWVYDLADA
jgi:hypothetical protein